MLIVVHYCYRFLCTVVTDSCALLLPFFVHSPYHFLCTRDFCLHWWKRKYSNQEVPEGFLPVSGGVLPASMPTHNSVASSKVKSRSDTTGENWMSIELRTSGGTDMRIQGGLTPAMVYTILKSL